MGYVTTTECAAENVSVNGDDGQKTRLQAYINMASRRIDMLCGWWFEPRAQTFELDGSGSPLLRFDAPIIAIDAVYEDDTLVAAEEYVVFNRHLAGLYGPDDRVDPRIERITGTSYPTLMVEPVQWTEGQKNYEVQGTFGYTEYDGHDDTVLPFDNQTGNFTVGDTVTGGTSGATGVIASQVDAGTTGTLTLTAVVGHFADNETITDPHGGSATANITTHWQGVTPATIKVVTMLEVKRFISTIGNAMFEATFLRGTGADDASKLDVQLSGHRVIDELLLPYVRPPRMRIV